MVHMLVVICIFPSKLHMVESRLKSLVLKSASGNGYVLATGMLNPRHTRHL